ncbi:MAG: hypothetical protein IKG42_06905 [Clostridia bacterium]|nr:hypothetical protein [Clostridia bacterium]
MEENKNQEPEVKVSGKKTFNKGKIIGIVAFVACIAIIAGMIALYFTGHLNLTKKDKVWNSIKKAGEVFSDTTDDISKKTNAKISDKIFDSSAIEYSAEITADIEEVEIEDLSSSEQKVIDNIIEIVNDSKIKLDVSADLDEKEFYAKANAKVDGVVDSISGEVVFEDDNLSIRSEELNDKYLTISKKYLEKEMGSSFDEVYKVIDNLSGSLDELMLEEKEIKHFKDTYKKVIEKEIKSKKMESSSGKVKVNGKQKSCTKVVVSLDEDDVKDLARKIVDTFDEDEKGKEIIKKRIVKVSKLAGEELSEREVEKYMDQFVDQANDAIDEISFNGKIKITAYATLFNIYRVDFDYSEGGQSAGVQFVFDGKKTTITADVAGQKIGNITIVNDKKEKELSFELDEDIGSYIGLSAKGSIKLEIEDKKFTTTVEANGEYKNQEINIKLVDEETRTKDTDSELERENKISFDIDIPDVISAKGKFNIDDSIKLVNSIDIPNTSNSVDIENNSELQKYSNECEKNAEKLLEKIKDSDAIKAIMKVVS